MTESPKEIKSIDTSVFQEKIVLENYFAGGNRDEVLSRMIELLQSGVTLMVLTGDEGSGKTMMCHMLENEVPPSFTTVFFQKTVDSFEDVVRLVAARLGLGTGFAEDGQKVEATMQQIIELLQSEQRDLLVIFDEAENIYLATLERIRKMLDRVTDLDGRMHILFSGRKTFLENCDQLSICDFQNTDEVHFDLLPLSETETGDYLKKCSEQLQDEDGEQIVFDDVTVTNIYSIAKGNFRMTNFLAEDAVSVNGDETSFKVLIDSVKESGDVEGEESGKNILSDLLRQYGDYLPWIGGVLCILILLVFLFRPDSQQEESENTVEQSKKFETIIEKPKEKTVQKKQEPTKDIAAKKDPPKQPEALEKPPLKQQVPKEEEVAKQLPASDVPAKKEERTKIIETVSTTPPATETPPVSPEPQLDKKVEKEQVARISAKNKRKQDPLEQKAPKVIQPSSIQEPQVEEPPVVLYPTGTKKRKPGSKPEVRRNTITLQPRTEVQDVIATNAHFTVEQLLRKRSLAGAVWESGEKNKMYTVQLMVLASTTADRNLKQMLAKDRYRQEAGNFFIFRKATAPQNIFVFYGEYPTITMARLAQNSLPQFLRAHKPYAISIKEALDKIKR